MVRVGGGWTPLTEFLVKNDPCRGKLSQSFISTCRFYNYENSITAALVSQVAISHARAWADAAQQDNHHSVTFLTFLSYTVCFYTDDETERGKLCKFATTQSNGAGLLH